MRLRTAVLLLACLGIPLALFVLFRPITWGYGGYNTADDRVFFVDPSGPAARAGLRVGDQLEPLLGMENVAQFAGSVGTTVHFRAHRDGTVVPVNITFEEFPAALAVQQQFNKVLQALTALGAFLLALLLLVRARDTHLGARAAAVLVASGATALSISFGLTAGNALLAATFYNALPVLLTGALLYAMLGLLALYPPRETRVQRFAGVAGPILFIAFAVLFVERSVGIWLGRTELFDTFFSWTVTIGGLAVAVAIVDAIVNAPRSYRVPAAWLGTCWLIAGALGAIGPLTNIVPAFPILRSHYADVLNAAQTFFLAFGVAYAVLRYRLADINILVTRATVFGVVSLIIVAIFAASEWAISRIFERSFSITDASGAGQQAATIVLAIALGISSRPIDEFVDSPLDPTLLSQTLERPRGDQTRCAGIRRRYGLASDRRPGVFHGAADSRPVARRVLPRVRHVLPVDKRYRGAALNRAVRRERRRCRALAALARVVSNRG